MASLSVSIIIPVYNEASNLPLLYSRLRESFAQTSICLELVFVDDGSTDETPALLTALHHSEGNVTVLTLTKNFGQNAALWAGVDNSTTDLCLSLDADLEYRPEDLLPLVRSLESGAKVVNGRRPHPQSTFFHRVAHSMAARITGTNCQDFFSPVKGAQLSIRDEVNKLKSTKAFAGLTLLKASRGRVVEVPIRRGRRLHGQTRYSNWSLARRFLELCMLAFWGWAPYRGYRVKRVQRGLPMEIAAITTTPGATSS